MSQQIKEVLLKANLFRHLSPAYIDQLAAFGQLRSFERGTAVFFEGDECPGIYCVSQGLVRVFKTAPNGKEHILHFASPGMTFAEVAVIGGFACPAHAEALEETVCVLLPKREFLTLVSENHQFCQQLLLGMAQWVRHLISLLEDLVLKDALGRVAAYLLRTAGEQAEVALSPILKKDFASHLNLTSETVSRTLRRLSELGAVNLGDPRRIVINDRRQLQELAEGTGSD